MNKDLSRDIEIDIIKKCFERLSDSQSSDIYNIFIKDVATDKKIIQDRKNILNYVMTNLFYAKDTTINSLYVYMDNKSLVKKKDFDNIIEENKEESDNDSDDPEYVDDVKDPSEYDIVLTVINSILEVNGKLKIRRLEQFQNILRDVLLTTESYKAVSAHEKLIFTKFQKSSVGYYQKRKTGSYALNVIKGMVKQLDGYEFKIKTHRNKIKCDKPNFTSYSIIQI
jgi:hypothetical protein